MASCAEYIFACSCLNSSRLVAMVQARAAAVTVAGGGATVVVMR